MRVLFAAISPSSAPAPPVPRSSNVRSAVRSEACSRFRQLERRALLVDDGERAQEVETVEQTVEQRAAANDGAETKPDNAAVRRATQPPRPWRAPAGSRPWQPPAAAAATPPPVAHDGSDDAAPDVIMPDAEAAARRALWDAPQDAADDAEDDGDDGAAAVEAGEAGGVEGFSEAALPEEGAAAAARRAARPSAPAFRPAPARPAPRDARPRRRRSRVRRRGGRPLGRSSLAEGARGRSRWGRRRRRPTRSPAGWRLSCSKWRRRSRRWPPPARMAPPAWAAVASTTACSPRAPTARWAGCSAAQARAAGGGAPGGGDMGSAITNMLMSATRDAGAANGGGDGYRGFGNGVDGAGGGGDAGAARRPRRCSRSFQNERPAPAATGVRPAAGAAAARRASPGAVAQPRVPASGLELAAADADAADDDGRFGHGGPGEGYARRHGSCMYRRRRRHRRRHRRRRRSTRTRRGTRPGTARRGTGAEGRESAARDLSE